MALARLLIFLSLAAFLGACGGPGDSATVPTAQPADATSSDIGDFVVHFSAQTTDQLPPEVARAYNIVRSKSRAMLNVSVIRKSDNQSVPASISVKATTSERLGFTGREEGIAALATATLVSP